MVPVRVAGALAMLVQHTRESSRFSSVTITRFGICLMRIGALSDAPGASAAEASPVACPAPDADTASTSVLRDTLLRHADPVPPQSGFELDHLCPLCSGNVATTWAPHRLDLTGPDLLEIYAMAATARMPTLLDRLDHGTRFRLAEA